MANGQGYWGPNARPVWGDITAQEAIEGIAKAGPAIETAAGAVGTAGKAVGSAAQTAWGATAPAVGGFLSDLWASTQPSVQPGYTGGNFQRSSQPVNRGAIIEANMLQAIRDEQAALAGHKNVEGDFMAMSPVQEPGRGPRYTGDVSGRYDFTGVPLGYTGANFDRTAQPNRTGYTEENFARPPWEPTGEPAVTYAGGGGVPEGYGAANFDRPLQEAMGDPAVTYAGLPSRGEQQDIFNQSPFQEPGRGAGTEEPVDFLTALNDMKTSDPDEFKRIETMGKRIAEAEANVETGSADALVASGDYAWVDGHLKKVNKEVFESGFDDGKDEDVVDPQAAEKAACAAQGGTWGLNGCEWRTPDSPQGFYQPVNLGGQIRDILGAPSTPDYSQDIRDLYAEMDQSVRERSAERTRVLDESVLRREGQIADIAEALVAELGPMEAARVLEQQGITADVIARGEGLTADAITRQERTRGELGPQVTDEYEQAAELVAGLTGSQATSSADLMSRLESLAGTAAAQREATPGMMEADALEALSDEEFKTANLIATDLANELGELDPSKAAALLKEKMRQGEFQTDEDMRIATALLGDLERRTMTVEQQWETARQETREDRRNAELDALRRDEIAGDTAAAQAEAAAAATIIGQLKNAGVSDEMINIARQGAGLAAWSELDTRDESLKGWLDQLQQSSIGGPKPMTNFERAQIEAAVGLIWDAERDASNEYFSTIEETFPGLMGGMDNPDWDRGEDYSIKRAA